MDVIAWMPAIVAGITACGPSFVMMLRSKFSKKKTDKLQSDQIEELRKGVEKNSAIIHEISGKLDSTHNDIRLMADEIRNHSIELTKQTFFIPETPAVEKMDAGLKYICVYQKNGDVSEEVHKFAEENPEILRAVLVLRPEYRAPWIKVKRRRKNEGKV